MPLSGLPNKTKYTPDDEVYILLDFVIVPAVIASWRVEVYDTAGDGSGTAVQDTYYKFVGRGEYEVLEREVFASENAVLGYIKNDVLNRAIESGSGGSGFFKAGINNNGDARSFGNWTDFACWDLKGAKFSIVDSYFAAGTVKVTHNSAAIVGTGTAFLLLPIGTEISAAPAGGFISAIADDTHLTLTAVQSFGSLPGTISTTNGSAVITGVSTTFAAGYISVGDTINCSGVRGVVSVINSNTQITMSLTSTATATGLSYTVSREGLAYEVFPPAIEVDLLRTSGGQKTLCFDGATLEDALLPADMSDPADNWADFRDVVRSYDAETTRMPNGESIGYP